MKKRFLSLLLVLAMLASLLAVPVSADDTAADSTGTAADTGEGFSDDTSTGTWLWAGDYIYACVDAGIINGYADGTFLPDGSLTRAEAAVILARAYGLSSDAAESSFSDVTAEYLWAMPYIEACAEAGIIDGYADGTFLPGQNVTRAEMAKLTAAAAGLSSDATESSFSDVTSGYLWALPYIEACAEAGIINGYSDGTFLPAGSVTRAEAAAMIARALDLLEEDDAAAAAAADEDDADSTAADDDDDADDDDEADEEDDDDDDDDDDDSSSSGTSSRKSSSGSSSSSDDDDSTDTDDEEESESYDFTVTFVDNDGTVLYTVGVNEGETISEPDTPEKEGYIFIAWYLDEDYEEQFLFGSDVITEDTTLYACWSTLEALIVEYVASSLSIGYASGDRSGYVTEDLTLPTEDEDYEDVEITWSSSSDAVTSEGIVTRPEKKNKDVTLTATVSYGEETAEVSFAVTVIHESTTDTEDLPDYSEEDLEDLNSGYDLYDLVYDEEDESQVISILGTYSDIVVETDEDALAVLQSVHTLIGLEDAYEELEYTSGSADDYSSEYHFAQYYSGYQVYGRTVTVSADSDGLTDYLNSGLLSTASFDDASCDIALSAGEAEAIVQAEYGDDCEIDSDDTGIVWYTLDDYEDAPVLVYNINVSGIVADEDGEEETVDEQVFVSAEDGTIVSTSTNISDASTSSVPVTGTNEMGEEVGFPVVVIKYTPSLNTDRYFAMQYLSENSSKLVMYDGSTYLSSYTPESILTETKIIQTDADNWDATAVSAYTNLITVYDWYLDSLDRDSVDGEGLEIDVIVHGYGKTDNAVWSSNDLSITFYDTSSYAVHYGADTSISTASALDVAAHEYNHGVMYFSCGAEAGGYSMTEGCVGAINEGYSDIFACLIDGNWEIGENWLTLRYIDDPTKETPEHATFPDSVTSEDFWEWGGHEATYYTEDGGAHHNSTIISHAAYLMSEDYRGKDKGLTTEELAWLWYKSMSKGYNCDSDFSTVRRNVLIAAYELQAAGELDDTDITVIREAFDEVGICEADTGTTCTVLVTDSDGSPISGAVLTFAQGDESVTVYITEDDAYVSEVTTDENGEAVFSLQQGTYEFTVTYGGFTKTVSVTISEADDSEVEIVLSDEVVETFSISGTISDSSGDPVSGATVSLKENDEIIMMVQTDDGTFTVPAEAGTYELVVTITGYKEYTETITVSDTDISDVVIVLSAEGEETILASGTCGDDLTWTLTEDGTLTISGTGAMTNWSQASSVSWYSWADSIISVVIGDGVTSIGDSAFEQCTSLAGVVIPSSVTSIGDWAFYLCTSLISIDLGGGVTTIGECAFYACTGLTSIDLGGSVITIDKCAFEYCPSLTSIDLGEKVTSIGFGAFYACALTSITIPSSVDSIGDWAFYGCTSLTEVIVDSANTSYASEDGVLFNHAMTELIYYPTGKIDTSYVVPDSVTTIGYYAFGSCTNLTSIDLGSVITIDMYAFDECTGLTSVTIPASLTSIDYYAFSGCTSLTDVYYTGSEEDWNKISISGSRGNTYLTSATIHYNYTE